MDGVSDRAILGSVAWAFVIAITAIPAEAKGCIKGAIVGGTAGHFAGHHGLMGAAAGCAVGHHEAKKEREGDAIPSLTIASWQYRPMRSPELWGCFPALASLLYSTSALRMPIFTPLTLIAAEAPLGAIQQ